MAKLAYSKLKLPTSGDIVPVEWNGFTIEVKNYLSIEEKLDLVQDIVNASVDNNGYYNPMKINMYLTVKTFFAFTNISVTEKQLESIEKIYDSLMISEIYHIVPVENYREIHGYVSEIIRSVYEYKNSAYGILDGITADYNNLELDASKIKEELADSDNLTLLKDVLTKLG